MKFKQHAFVIVAQDVPDGDPVEHRVVTTTQDRLRAEQVAARIGLPGIQDAPQTHAALWCWAALRRTGATEHNAEHWLNQVLVDFADDKAADVTVDPTRPAVPTP